MTGEKETKKNSNYLASWATIIFKSRLYHISMEKKAKLINRQYQQAKLVFELIGKVIASSREFSFAILSKILLTK